MGRREAQLSECFPYGVFRRRDGVGPPRIGVRVGDGVLDLATAAADRGSPFAGLLSFSSLDPLLAAGPDVWPDVHHEVVQWAEDSPRLLAIEEVDLLLPFTVADYVDFYASEHHATNVGRMFRPGQEPLSRSWRHQPVGYHGRAGTVVVSGTPVIRPAGHVLTDAGVPELRATERLDVEAEVGFVIGAPSVAGRPVGVEDAARHVFGVVLVNDWSARDIQAFETVPLGPFLGKSFQTSVSPWVVPLAAFDVARVRPPSLDGPLSSYLVESEPQGLDIDLELRVNGQLISRPPYRTMHWSYAQLLAHLTVNGASLRVGDLVASGTVSGAGEDEVGSLLERWAGERFLADGDEVVISGTAPAADGSRLDLGAVAGRVLPDVDHRRRDS